jgi:hypothetical protein
MRIRPHHAGALAPAVIAALALTASTAVAAASDLAAPASTAPVSATGTGTGYGQLVNVRTGRHDAYDRTVFDFTGGTPGYRVGYGTLTGQGTGDPIPLAGNASLVIVFHPAAAHDLATGASTYDISRTLDPTLPTLKQIRFGGDFEGYVSAGLGLTHTVGFRVFQLHSPDRVVVDVAHRAATGCGGA